MKNHVSRLLMVGLCFVFLGPMAAYGNTEDQMLLALQENNAALLAQFYADQVEISILGHSTLSSAEEAEKILSAFFAQFPVTSCQVIHHGNSTQSQFYILNLTVQNQQKFRVYALLRADENEQLIQQFRIDEAYE